MTTMLSAGDWEGLVDELDRCRLCDRDLLEATANDFIRGHADAGAAELGRHLVQRRILTAFQLERVLAGAADRLVLGPYVLIDAEGTREFGRAYRAVGQWEQRLFSLKLLPQDGRFNLRQIRRQAQGFADPMPVSLVPLVDFGTVGSQSFLTWAYVSGETIAGRIERSGPLSAACAVQIAVDVAESLRFLHRQQVWHGSINPLAIRIDGEGHAKLGDLGLGALFADGDVTPVGLPWPDCAPPETLLHPGHRSIRGDQYSLGITLYFALTGGYPFAGRSPAAVSEAHRRETVPDIETSVPTLPKALGDVVRRLTERDPLARFESPTELLDALKPLADEFGVKAPAIVRRKPVVQSLSADRPRVAPLLRQIREQVKDASPPATAGLEQTPLPRPVLQIAPPPADDWRPLRRRLLDGLQFWRTPAQEVEIALLAPDRVLAGERVNVQVVLFPSHEADQSRRLPDWRGSLMVPGKVSSGATVSLQLRLVDADANDGWREVTWHGEATHVDYRFRIPADWQPGLSLQGALAIAVGGQHAGELPFSLPVFGVRPTLARR